LGGWHAEWETLPEIVSLAAGALRRTVEIVPHLEIDAERMKANLDATQGLIYAETVTMALAEKLGKAKAHEVVEAACQRARAEKQHLRDIVLRDAKMTASLSAEQIDALFDARNYLGSAETFIDQVIAASSETD
jgi:3-carboxy-cis,cis-muconate cycloisomerase